MTTTKPESRLMTVEQVAAMLGVSEAWVYQRLPDARGATRRKPALPGRQLGDKGGVWRFRRSDIEQFIDEQFEGRRKSA